MASIPSILEEARRKTLGPPTFRSYFCVVSLHAKFFSLQTIDRLRASGLTAALLARHDQAKYNSHAIHRRQSRT